VPSAAHSSSASHSQGASFCPLCIPI
jgi:hypothetical protein